MRKDLNATGTGGGQQRPPAQPMKTPPAKPGKKKC